METLETLKNNYAQENGYEDWVDLAIHHELKADRLDQHWTEICILAQKAALENAEENACNSLELYNYEYDTLSKAITNPENLIR